MTLTRYAAGSGALLFAFGLAGPGIAHAAKAGMPGYQPQDAATVAGLPVHVVIEQAKVKPQIAYGYINVGYPNTVYPGMSMGQGLGVNLAGGLIASAIVNGAEYAQAKNFARKPYAVMQQAGCDLPIDQRFGAAVSDAARSAWPAATVQNHVLEGKQEADDVTGKDAPRYVLRVSSSLSTDFSALVTSIDADAYTQASARKPAWRDTLIVVSDRVTIPAKTQADIDQMVAAENERYAALDMGKQIARINAAGGNADRKERAKVVAALSEHNANLKEARRPQWTPASEALRRAMLLSENGCALLARAIESNATLAAAALSALADGTLPPRPAADATTPPATDAPGERAIVALPGGVFVSRRGGDEVNLGFRGSILSD